MPVFDRFREDAITTIYCAQEEAIRQSYGVVCTELLILGILSEEQKAGSQIAKAALVRKGVNREAVRRYVSDLASTRGPAPKPSSGSLPFSDNVKLLFDTVNAEVAAEKDIGSEQLLLALGQPALAASGAMKMLTSLGLTGDGLRKSVSEELSSPEGQREMATVGAEGGDENSTLTLDQVATDLTKMASEGLLDPMIGREEELQRIIQILLRKRKNNACLVGPAGVGKTAVAEGLAQLIVAGKVPNRLKGKQLYSLDLGQLVAGTKYRGEFEQRLKSIIDEVRSIDRDICLFIDEIHQLVGAGIAGGESAMDAANLLKPYLARGELQVIGATTLDEYVKHIEKDAALERRFQRVSCEEPTVAETIEILEGLRHSYEAHHGVLLAPEALSAAASLSGRYLPERFLPDKAVDLIDEAGSIAQWRAEIALEEANSSEQVPEALQKPVVTAIDIAQVLSKWSGVPVESINEDESGRLLRLEETLTKRIIGQQEAVSALARAVRRARAGLTSDTRPTASFYFAGPTGVGKTELCKVLAEEYYADPKALVRLDMSEYAESHSISRLIGAPPGYVGYNDPGGGQLTEAVRRKPYSVVVLDEIEKAHPEVMNMLLQVLEDGRLTDGKGRTVTFSNCIIVMTSNVGSKEILQQAGGSATYAEMRAAVQLQLQQKYRPEFLNRIDEVVIFRALGSHELSEIVKIILGDAVHRAAEAHQQAMLQGSESGSLSISWTADIELKVLSTSSDPRYGARPLRRAVQRCFEDPLAELLVSGALAAGGEATVDIEDDAPVVRYGDSTLRPQFFSMSLQEEVRPAAATSPTSAPESRPAAMAVFE
eukprot:CAMPEP_0197637678 /NCGR_PEP_ID=MMETSP1338-20131121/12825_1 /TAXON_ID=43686 ORGANISM="Pelagodinium beii, Strain RCC1491" /NCGR_SAMPLE_ID=MMETSP1338 /ASSEMBLY_ACC=CAM_ASM_000754 /LENGTH=826 /DNA_ID=CAMNT_0043210127 /DNA_START=11 /DNA_END=2490 /DNA_ORIENTATION=-